MEKKLQKPIQSIQRAVQILDCFTPTDPSLPLSAISEKTGLNINTTRGLVNTLVESQLLLRDQDTGCYKLGYYFVTKASMIRQDIDRYVELFKPLVDAAAEKYHFSASLQMVYQNQIFSVYCAYPTKQAYYIVMSEYTDLPLHATSSGKLLLLDQITHGRKKLLDQLEYKAFTPASIRSREQLEAQLKTIKKNGYSTEIEEFVNDVGSLAVPLYDEKGRLLLTLSATFFVKSLPKIKEDLLKYFQKAIDTWKQVLKKGECL
ncbi:IclR family transcriptional regulator [Acidaminococcus sp. CAG:542]|uniref:IclR family transcriptional regulator n=1 Tax=Acidaminococcus sp. CAG:542 TaxID=1262687 RepID=UPI00034149D4|nr:IclR family transcriptional regulator [Acidaminococcus sp. CAG:542]CDE94267.1 transcriptional regulator IclR family [Acidaminococcus sp. CAG:542]